MTANSAAGAKPTADAKLNADAKANAGAKATVSMPSVRWRWALSVLIVWQLWAVLGEPVEFMTRGPMGVAGSPAGEAFNRPVKAYGQFTYLNHGYAFFAPDPGPSHLMEVRVADPTGEPRSETFPDLQQQWPRLLYHRHFMLTEFLHNLHTARLPPELRDSDADEINQWRASRRQYEAIRDSFRRHIASTEGVDVEQVSIARIEHRAPFVPEYLLDSVRLRDARLYTELPDELTPLPNQPLPNQPLPNQPLPGLGRPGSPEWTPRGTRNAETPAGQGR